MNSHEISEPLEVTSRTTDAICPTHGPYTQRQVTVGRKTVTLSCPQCPDAKRLAEEARIDAQRVTERVKELTANSGIPVRFRERTLDNYRPLTPACARVLGIARRYVATFGDGTGALVLCGKPGTGKTHLACGIGHALIAQGTSVMFTGVLAAIRKIKDTYRPGSEVSETEALRAFTRVDLLILDEIGVQVGSEHEKMLLFEIINDRYQNCRATILISNLTAQELAAYLGDRVLDRVREDGAVIAFNWSSYRAGGGS